MAEYRKNLANAIVATMTASTTATSIPLVAGYGATMPAVPFFMTYTPPGQLSTLGNSEIVLVSAISTDTLTVVRAQKGTTAKLITTGWICSASILRETSLAVGDIITTLNATAGNGRVFMAGQTLNKSDYPLLYDHVLNNAGYGTTSGGTTFTLKDMRSRVPVGKAASGTFATIAATGGAETHTHTLDAAAAMIGANQSQQNTISYANSQNGDLASGSLYSVVGSNNTALGRSHNTKLTGTTDSSSHLQPYIVVQFEVVAS